MRLPRLLLTACTAPCPQGVGGIFLQDLCRLFGPGELAGFFSLSDAEHYRPPPDLAAQMPISVHPMMSTSLPPTRGGMLGKGPVWLRQEWRFRSRVRELVEAATAFGRTHRPDKLWAVLDAPESIALAAPLARSLGVPLCTLVWDDVAQIAAHFSLDRLSARRLRRDFGAAIGASECCAVIGEPMAEEYAARYGARCVVVRHGMGQWGPERHDEGTHESTQEGAAFRIGLVGTMSAPCAFNALVAALDTVDWRIAGRPLELWVTGPRLDVRSMRPAAVRYFGWRPTVDETVQLLAQTHLAYMPQPFGAHSQELARLSFPAKLTTYLAAGRPILLHAPVYASLTQYHQQHGLGEWCGSLEPAAIVRALEGLVGQPHRRSQLAALARQAYKRDFTAKRFHRSFAAFVCAEHAPMEPA